MGCAPVCRALRAVFPQTGEQQWHAVNAPHLVAPLRAGARFEKGQAGRTTRRIRRRPAGHVTRRSTGLDYSSDGGRAEPARQPTQPTVGAPMPTVNGDRIRALRYAREVVWDMRWLGMTVPPLYASMAEELRSSCAAAPTPRGSPPSRRPEVRSGRCVVAGTRVRSGGDVPRRGAAGLDFPTPPRRSASPDQSAASAVAAAP
jgi:hypothetical protein